MKKYFIIGLVLTLCLVFSAPAFADDEGGSQSEPPGVEYVAETGNEEPLKTEEVLRPLLETSFDDYSVVEGLLLLILLGLYGYALISVVRGVFFQW